MKILILIVGGWMLWMCYVMFRRKSVESEAVIVGAEPTVSKDKIPTVPELLKRELSLDQSLLDMPMKPTEGGRKNLQEAAFFAQSAIHGFEQVLVNKRLALSDFKKCTELEPNNKHYREQYLRCDKVIKDIEKKITMMQGTVDRAEQESDKETWN